MRHLTRYQISAHFDGFLAGVSRELVDRHLGVCKACRGQRAHLESTHHLLAALLTHEPGQEFFAGMEALLEQQIRDRQRSGELLRLPPELARHIAREAVLQSGERWERIARRASALHSARPVVEPSISSETVASAPVEPVVIDDRADVAAAAAPVPPAPEPAVIEDREDVGQVAVLAPPAPAWNAPRRPKRRRKRRLPKAGVAPSTPAPTSAQCHPVAAPSSATPVGSPRAPAKARSGRAPALMAAAAMLVFIATAAWVLSPKSIDPPTGERAAASFADGVASDGVMGDPEGALPQATDEGAARSIPVPEETPPPETPKPSATPSTPARPRRALAGPMAHGLLCGVVQDEAGRPVPRAQVLVADLRLAAVTDRRGRFCLSAPQGSRTVSVAAPGYETRRLPITIAERTGEIAVALRATVAPGAAAESAGRRP